MRALTGYLLLATAALIWGGMYVVSRALLGVVSSGALVWLRLVVGVAAMAAVWAWHRPRLQPQPPGRRLRESLELGMLGFGLSLELQFLGTQLSSAHDGAVVTSLTPAFAVLFARWWLGQPVPRRALAGLALSTVGVVVLLGAPESSPHVLLGELLLVGAALTWAAYTVRGVTPGRRDGPAATLTLALGAGAVITLPLGAGGLQHLPAAAFSPAFMAGVLYLGVLSTALAFWAWNQGFARVPAAKGAPLFFLQPLSGAGLGALLLGEHLGGRFLAGAAVILAGVALAIWPPAAPAPAIAAMSVEGRS